MTRRDLLEFLPKFNITYIYPHPTQSNADNNSLQYDIIGEEEKREQRSVMMNWAQYRERLCFWDLMSTCLALVIIITDRQRLIILE